MSYHCLLRRWLPLEHVCSRQPLATGVLGRLIPALFIGGSNADRLANAAGNVGVVPDTVTEGGWVLNTTSVSTALPQIEAYCLTLPAEAPVIINCLDNASFCQADGDGVITQIIKLADNKFHVVGFLSGIFSPDRDDF